MQNFLSKVYLAYQIWKQIVQIFISIFKAQYHNTMRQFGKSIIQLSEALLSRWNYNTTSLA